MGNSPGTGPPGAGRHPPARRASLPASSGTPKALPSLAGRSMLAHALHAAHEIKPSYLIPVIGHDREQVGAAVNAVAVELDRAITPTIQEQQLGTGHAVQCALESLPDDFTGD